MRILLIGANGFIGSHVAGHLAACGHAVTRADIPGGPDPECLEIDARLPDFPALYGTDAWDVVINCAGAASVPDSFKNPLRDFELNTVRVAEMLAGLHSVGSRARFINLSSAAVYGNPTRTPIRESDAVAPLSPYGWHKAQAELLCRQYHQLYGMPTLSLRVFSAFGPGLRKQLFWDVYQKVLAGGPLELFGTGEETRDFIYVHDIAVCIELVIRLARFEGQAVNLASNKSVTVRNAVLLFLQTLGMERVLRFSGSTREGDPPNWRADVSQLSALGFAPTHSLQQGLIKVAEWLAQSASSSPRSPS